MKMLREPTRAKAATELAWSNSFEDGPSVNDGSWREAVVRSRDPRAATRRSDCSPDTSDPPMNGHRKIGPACLKSANNRHGGPRKIKDARQTRRPQYDYFNSVITGLSLALMRITSVFEGLSVAFRPKCFVFGGVYTTSPALTILVPTPSISKVCSPSMT
jgi:hypothetical protein